MVFLFGKVFIDWIDCLVFFEFLWKFLLYKDFLKFFWIFIFRGCWILVWLESVCIDFELYILKDDIGLVDLLVGFEVVFWLLRNEGMW